MLEKLDEAARISAGISERDIEIAQELMRQPKEISDDLARTSLIAAQVENLTANIRPPRRPGFVR